jgi:lysophospholipase L1-like esterase
VNGYGRRLTTDKDYISRKYNFGSGELIDGYVAVSPGSVYSSGLGYGFDFDSTVRVKHLEGDGILKDCVVGDKPFFFSVDVPEGNYSVKVTLGRSDTEFDTTIRSETRRLMLENILTHAENISTLIFTVNVRNTSLPGVGSVRLKERELPYWHRDSKLTLEFNGSTPQVAALEIQSAPDLITLYLAGDSTVCDQPGEPRNSWGQMLTRFFNPQVAVANHAMSGESIKSSLGAGRFDKIFSQMKPGDYLFVQYGHNDMKDTSPDALEVYCRNLSMIIDRTRSKQATPVLVTSMERKKGVAEDTLRGYPDAVRRVAKEREVALIDLNTMSK